MTENEAIKSLELCKESRIFIPNNIVLDMAIQALEKQVAKKPIWIKRSFTQFQVCPSCSDAENYRMVSRQEIYCHRCGQRIDWGNEDE